MGLWSLPSVSWKNRSHPNWDGVGRSCGLYSLMFIHFMESLILPFQNKVGHSVSIPSRK